MPPGQPGQRDHAVRAEQRGQPDGVTQRPVVLAGQVLVGVQRIAPGVQRVDLQPVPGDGGQPRRPGLAAGEQARHVAVRVRRVATRADLEMGDLGSGSGQPAQDPLQRPVEECLKHYADAQAARPSLAARVSLAARLSLAARSLPGAPSPPLADGGHPCSASRPGKIICR